MSNTDIDRLLLNGERFKTKIHQRITAADLNRTIEYASTLSVTVHDPRDELLESKQFDSRVTTQLDKRSFELVQLKKTGDSLTLTFEDLAVARMRDKKGARKVAPGTMTREQFARKLVDEIKWLKFRGPKGKQPKTKIAMARGKKENTWKALERLAAEVGWARFVVDDRVFFLPEEELFDDPIDYVLRKNDPAVENIDFDYDVGKPVATITATVLARRWAVPPGSVVRVPNLGPASGKWLVTALSGSLLQTHRTVTLRKPEPALPEPKPPKQPDSDYEDTGGGGTAPAGGSGKGDWVWPCKGTVTSEYGSRSSGFHYGIDIGAPMGTPIVAARDGVVIFAGAASGYGTAVYINHGGGVICRYGHMSVIRCTRGQSVSRGQRIADVGQEGNSTGPHLHFEYRPGDSPRNPREIL